MANTIQDKLAYLEETKGLIKQAIVAKGVDVSDTDTFRSYANKIEAIQAGGGGTTNIPDGTKFAYSSFTTVPDSFIPYLETQNDMDNMFKSCLNLASIPFFNTSNVTGTNNMFSYCYSLQRVPQFDTNRVTDAGYMFYNCSGLQTVPLLKFSSVTEISYIFYGCYSLTNLGGFTGLKVNLDLYESSKLTVDSVMNVINNAADMTESPKTLTLHKDVFNKLTQEQIATASAKGWNIARW